MCDRPLKLTGVIRLGFFALAASSLFAFASCETRPNQESVVTDTTTKRNSKEISNTKTPERSPTALVDTSTYNKLVLQLAHGQTDGKWPVIKPYPLAGAILPYNRIIAYYGNFYAKGMGVLGALPEEEMIAKLTKEVALWQAADSTTKAIPAIHYIAVSAQRLPGKGKKYRIRMPGSQIEKAVEMARRIKGIVFIDIQTGHSSLQEEVPELAKYLAIPEVHLGVDPEYSMKGGEVPGDRVGTFSAADINFTIDYLAEIVRKNNIPPKVLVVHRFTQNMVTNATDIKPKPEVQVVMHMDGFGYPAKKIDSYKRFVASEPVQFTGFKLFYKNDIQDPRWPSLMKPEEVLQLHPQPVYIQYQ